MSIPAQCENCRHAFDVADSLAGGSANCPSCGRATEVVGLRDPLWRVMQAGAVVFAVLAGWASTGSAGPIGGVAIGLAVWLLLWLGSRAM